MSDLSELSADQLRELLTTSRKTLNSLVMNRFLDNDDKSKFRSGFSILADAPPVFMLVAHDDTSNPIEAAML